jgi:hypothetical protein
MSQKEVDNLFNHRDVALLIHDLETVFGKNNLFVRQLHGGEKLSMFNLCRALLRNQMHLTVRLERIEDRIGQKWDPQSLENKVVT